MIEWIVTSSAMILIVIALRGLLKGKISLRLQYGLWALVLVRLLLPFSIVDSAISISNVLSAPVIKEADTAVSDYRDSYESLRDEYYSRGEAVTDDDIRLQVQQELFNNAYTKLEQEYTHSGEVVSQTQIQAEAQRQVQVISLTAVIAEALPYFWIAGMIAVAAVLAGSNIHFWWKLRQSRKALDIDGVPLKVYLTDYVATPCLFGLGKPDIYLTGEVMTDSQMRRHVLAHEMSHYRQGDHIWSVLRSLCLVLHWYNPLVWAAAILSKQDAELACDEATIKALGETERTAYGRTLIGMTCVRRDPRSLMLTATTMLGTKKTLKDRISLIARKPRTAIYTLIACVLVAAIAVGCTFTGAPTEPTDPSRELITEPTIEPTTDQPTVEPTLEHTEPPTEPTTESTEEPTELPTEPTVEPTEPNPEIAKFQGLLKNDEWLFRIIGCVFERPEEISLEYMLYRGLPVDERENPSQYSQSEIDFLKNRLRDTFWGEDAWDDAYKFPAYRLDEILQQYLGVSLEDVVIPDRWIYFSETNAYYDVRTDSYAVVPTVTDVQTDDNGRVYIYWTTPYITDTRHTEELVVLHDPQMVTVLEMQTDGSYQALMNMSVEKLTDVEDVEYFQNLLTYENGYWYWRAMGCVFEEPDELNVRYLFYNGLPSDESQNSSEFTDSEVEFLQDYALEKYGDESVWVNAHKLPREAVNDVLATYFGVTLNTVSIPEDWAYFEETESYYVIRFDGKGVTDYTITDVKTNSYGVYYVYWTTNLLRDTRYEESVYLENPQMIMMLKERANGGYLVLTNAVWSDLYIAD